MSGADITLTRRPVRSSRLVVVVVFLIVRVEPRFNRGQGEDATLPRLAWHPRFC